MREEEIDYWVLEQRLAETTARAERAEAERDQQAAEVGRTVAALVKARQQRDAAVRQAEGVTQECAAALDKVREEGRREGRAEVAAAVLKLCAHRHFGAEANNIVRAVTALVEPLTAPCKYCDGRRGHHDDDAGWRPCAHCSPAAASPEVAEPAATVGRGPRCREYVGHDRCLLDAGHGGDHPVDWPEVAEPSPACPDCKGSGVLEYDGETDPTNGVVERRQEPCGCVEPPAAAPLPEPSPTTPLMHLAGLREFVRERGIGHDRGAAMHALDVIGNALLGAAAPPQAERTIPPITGAVEEADEDERRALARRAVAHLPEPDPRDAEIARLRAAIDRDRTGLAAALAEVERIAGGYSWIPDGAWGSYEEQDHTLATLRAEVGQCLDAIREKASAALTASGNLAQRTLFPDRYPDAIAAAAPQGAADYDRGRDDCTAAVIDLLLHPPGFVGEGSPLWTTVREEVVPALKRGAHHDRMPRLAPQGGMEPATDWRHAPAYPTEPPEPDCSWVWCWKEATGPAQRPGWRWELVDVGVADLVHQLNLPNHGDMPLLPTAGSCGGHKLGELPHVLLQDGRVLVVLPSQARLDAMVVEERWRPGRVRREREE